MEISSNFWNFLGDEPPWFFKKIQSHTFIWNYLVASKFWRFHHIFVAFSEYMNFKFTDHIYHRIYFGFAIQFPNGNLNFRSLCALPFGGLGLLASFHSFAMHFLAPCQDQESATIAGCQFFPVFGYIYFFYEMNLVRFWKIHWGSFGVSEVHQITLTYYKRPLFLIKCNFNIELQCYKRETLTHFFFIAAVFYNIT